MSSTKSLPPQLVFTSEMVFLSLSATESWGGGSISEPNHIQLVQQVTFNLPHQSPRSHRLHFEPSASFQYGLQGLQAAPGSGGHVGPEWRGQHRLHQPEISASLADRTDQSSRSLPIPDEQNQGKRHECGVQKRRLQRFSERHQSGCAYAGEKLYKLYITFYYFMQQQHVITDFPLFFKGEVGMKEEGKSRKKDKKKEKEEYPNSWLITTIFKSFKWILLESAFFKLLQDVLAFVSPQLLKWVWDECACFQPQIWLISINSQQTSKTIFSTSWGHSFNSSFGHFFHTLPVFPTSAVYSHPVNTLSCVKSMEFPFGEAKITAISYCSPQAQCVREETVREGEM